MDSKKYDFIQKLLNDKRLNAAQRDRILALTQKEIEKDSSQFKTIEERIEYLENSIYRNKEEDFLETNINNSIIEGNDNSTILKKINHNPQQTYDIFRSFKMNDGKYAFKFLVHGFQINSIEEYNEKIAQAEADFTSLNIVPKNIYNNIRALIYLYKNYGLEIVEKDLIHPFDSDIEIEIKESDLKILGSFFWINNVNGKNTYFKTFRTAIQNFKKKYRFDVTNSEASILRDFLLNVIKFESFDYNNEILSFKNSVGLFNENQLKFDIKRDTFFAFNPSIKEVIKWITSSILKHSTINGYRDFNPLDKEIKISTKEMYDEELDHNFIFLEIMDVGSKVTKSEIKFFDSLCDNCSEILKSVCDFEVFFTTNENKNYSCSVLPKDSPKPVPFSEEDKGIKYRFKFITN
ncbi:hypothetical protein [Empedobacter falsenii]|uniref:Uncharacterized protein n=1 Tax=Empedobacter falsenii TaxID=343874 RepID=A0AAW7DI65_9FLAO|nr:hypothetical protein [Empedobacter falsenii]MDM1551648.1 hypothetical protein [Empedobacter falsenii]